MEKSRSPTPVQDSISRGQLKPVGKGAMVMDQNSLQTLPTELLAIICKFIFQENKHTFPFWTAIRVNAILRARVFAELCKYQVSIHPFNYFLAKQAGQRIITSIQDVIIRFHALRPREITSIFNNKGTFQKVHLTNIETLFTQRIWNCGKQIRGMEGLIPTILSQSDRVKELLLTFSALPKSNMQLEAEEHRRSRRRRFSGYPQRTFKDGIQQASYHLGIDPIIVPNSNGDSTTTWKWVADEGHVLEWQNVSKNWNSELRTFLDPSALEKSKINFKKGDL